MDSMTGVIGWLLATPCDHVGIVSVGTKALEVGEEEQGESIAGRRGLACNEADGGIEPSEGKDEERDQTDGKYPLQKSGRSPESDEQGHSDNDECRQHVSGKAGYHMSCNDTDALNGHGAEAVNDAIGHILGDIDGRAGRSEAGA